MHKKGLGKPTWDGKNNEETRLGVDIKLIPSAATIIPSHKCTEIL